MDTKNVSGVITSDVVIAFAQCPRKAFLLLHEPVRPPSHTYETILSQRAGSCRERLLSRLERVPLPTMPGKAQDTELELRAVDLVASCDAVKRVGEHGKTKGGPQHPQHGPLSPILAVGTFTVTPDQRLALAFAGHVQGLIQGSPSRFGTIVTRDDGAHHVDLGSGLKEVKSSLDALRGMQGPERSDVPPIVLNRHCPLCPFRDDCRTKAEAADDLSLLDRMTPKAIRRYKRKGIFTVKQLSFLYRPRRSKRRPGPTLAFKLELQALAIRTGKIYLQTSPSVTRTSDAIFLDMEGIPDEHFHYLIGLLVCHGDERATHSLWADKRADEARIWGELRTLLDAIPNLPIFHYGSYEPRAVELLGKRYETDVRTYMRRMINVNEAVFARVYFPVRSNGLKDIGRFLGATWSDPDASGLNSVVWRYQWEEAADDELKAKIIRYNQDDCGALAVVWQELARIAGSADADSSVDFADRPKQFATEAGNIVHARFAEILRSAHEDYQKNRLTLRKEEGEGDPKAVVKKRGAQEGHQAYHRVRPRVDRVVTVARKRVCWKHPVRLEPLDEVAEAFQIDLRLTRNGCKKTVTKYVGPRGRCPRCQQRYLPPTISRFRGRLFGHGFQAWAVYQRVTLRLPYRVIATVMDDLFGERISSGTVVKFMRDQASYYGPCERVTLGRLLAAAPFLHVDETLLNIQGTNHYAWVVTDGHRVVFRLTETREPDMLQELLAGYQGVLVSDFYAGYDGFKCRQQKCLAHLIRDLNDDLWDCPFNTEFEGFVLAVKDLLVPMIEATDGRSSKRRRAKFEVAIDRFYKRWITDREYEFEGTEKYRKRFDRYRDSLFMFMRVDGIPWNNNMAERAIRHLAVQRKISGTFFKDAIPSYLLLLGIAQTCRFQNKSFLKFLMSGSRDVDTFTSVKRRSASRCVSVPAVS